MEKIILEKLPWLQQFATGDNEPVMRKSVLKHGDHIGAYNSAIEFVWLERSLLVIPVEDESTDMLVKLVSKTAIAN